MNDMSRRLLPPQGMDPEEPQRPRHGRSGPFGVLDIGSTKVVCLIGRQESDGQLRVLGFGWHRGKGVRGDTDRIGQRLLGGLLTNILASQFAMGLTAVERPVPAAGRGGLVGAHCGFASAHERAFYCPKCGMRLLRG